MSDRIEDHYGQQLSALMDGALAPDRARFLLRRLQHDHELAGTWERWQLAGEVLRGRAEAVLPAGFAERVGTALAADLAATPVVAHRASPRWLRWSGGAALAASVAVVALFVARQAPEAGDAEQAAPIVASAPAQSAPAPEIAIPDPATVRTAPVEAAPTRAIAAVQSPRPRVSRPRPDAVAASRRAPDSDAGSRVASTPARDPFASDVAPARPWPRAVLPQFGSGGTLATGTAPSFYPFEPRLPQQGAPEDPEASPVRTPDETTPSDPSRSPF